MGKFNEAKVKNNNVWCREFSERIKAILKKKKMTQIELAKKTKIVESQLSHYIRGYYVPNVRDAIKIALALEVDFMDLFGFMEQKSYPVYLA